MTSQKLSRAILICLGAVFTPFANSYAVTTTLNYTGSAIINGVQLGYESGYIAPNPDSLTVRDNVYIGGDNVTSSVNILSSTQPFNVWCVDIYHWMTGTADYTVKTGNDLAAALTPISANGSLRVTELLELADEFYGNIHDQVSSAAFQLAVWAVTYGTADSSGHYAINSSNPGFNVDANTAASAFGKLANTWLATLGQATFTANYTLTYLSDAGFENTQDLVTFTPYTGLVGNSGTVPEPASLALLCIGLAGWPSVRRKLVTNYTAIA